MTTPKEHSSSTQTSTGWVDPVLKPYHKMIARLLPLALCTLTCYTIYTIYIYYNSAEVHRTTRLDREVKQQRQRTNYRIGQLESEERASEIEKRVTALGLALEMPSTPPIFILDSTRHTNND